jgi:hypothetical protein
MNSQQQWFAGSMSAVAPAQLLSCSDSGPQCTVHRAQLGRSSTCPGRCVWWLRARLLLLPPFRVMRLGRLVEDIAICAPCHVLFIKVRRGEGVMHGTASTHGRHGWRHWP